MHFSAEYVLYSFTGRMPAGGSFFDEINAHGEIIQPTLFQEVLAKLP